MARCRDSPRDQLILWIYCAHRAGASPAQEDSREGRSCRGWCVDVRVARRRAGCASSRRADRRRGAGGSGRQAGRGEGAALGWRREDGDAARGHERADLPRRQPQGRGLQRRLLPQGPRSLHGARPRADRPGRHRRQDARHHALQGSRRQEAVDSEGRLPHRHDRQVVRRRHRTGGRGLHPLGRLRAVCHCGHHGPAHEAGARRAVADGSRHRRRAHHDQPAASAGPEVSGATSPCPPAAARSGSAWGSARAGRPPSGWDSPPSR